MIEVEPRRTKPAAWYFVSAFAAFSSIVLLFALIGQIGLTQAAPLFYLGSLGLAGLTIAMFTFYYGRELGIAYAHAQQLVHTDALMREEYEAEILLAERQAEHAAHMNALARQSAQEEANLAFDELGSSVQLWSLRTRLNSAHEELARANRFGRDAAARKVRNLESKLRAAEMRQR